MLILILCLEFEKLSSSLRKSPSEPTTSRKESKKRTPTFTIGDPKPSKIPRTTAVVSSAVQKRKTRLQVGDIPRVNYRQSPVPTQFGSDDDFEASTTEDEDGGF